MNQTEKLIEVWNSRMELLCVKNPKPYFKKKMYKFFYEVCLR